MTEPTFKKIPTHIAIIMDGNGRWAMKRRKLRVAGHLEGAKRVRKVTEECARLGVKRLTLFAFSSENWKRPKEEVDTLMELLKDYLQKELETMMKNNIRFKVVGRTELLPQDVQRLVNDTIEKCSRNTGMKLTLALSYGGRDEIVDAARKIAQSVASGKLKPEDISEEVFNSCCYDCEMEPVDLLIRTGGEFRISNFLLWHLYYAEIYVIKELWPEFSVKHLHDAIEFFASRERRFGMIPNDSYSFSGTSEKKE